MAEETLKVIIGADTFEGEEAIKRFNKLLRDTKPSANTATFALTNLGRVAQDLPFGFIGIANNLNPLLESFQRLRQEAGSNVGALKLLGSSLMGAGGIGLALSAATAIISIASFGLSAWTGRTKQAKEETDKFKESIKDINKLQSEAVASTQGQIATVNELAAIITDANKPYVERKRALQELKEVNKSYFGDLTLESAQMGVLKAKVEEYTKALIQQAIVKKFADAIADTAKAAADQQREVDKAAKSVELLNKELAKQQAIGAQTEKRPAFFAGEDVNNAIKINEVTTKLTAAQEKLGEEQDKMFQLNVQDIEQRKVLHSAIEKTVKLKDLNTQATKKEIDTTKELNEELKKLFRTSTIIAPTGEQTEMDRMLHGILDSWDKFTEKLKAPRTAVLPIKEAIITPLARAQEELRGKLEAFNKSFEESAEGLRNTAIIGLAEAFGSIIGGGGFKNAISGFLNLMAGALEEIGRSAVLAGIAMLNLKKIFETSFFTNPAAVIVAGLAMIALGAAIKAAVPHFAEGGVVTKPTLGLFGEAGPEAVIPLNKMGGMFGNNVTVQGEFRIRGRDLVAVVDTGQRSLNRIT